MFFQVCIFTMDGRSEGLLSNQKLKHPRGICSGLGLVAVIESRRKHVSLFDLRDGSKSIIKHIPLETNFTGKQHLNCMTNGQIYLTEPYYIDFIESGKSGYLAITDWAAPNLKLYSLAMNKFVASVGNYGTNQDNVSFDRL